MYCNNCNRNINVESTICPICGAKIIDKVVWIKTGIIIRIGAVMFSLLAIAFICGGWAEKKEVSYWSTYSKEFSIFDLEEKFDFIGDYVNSSEVEKYENIFAFASFISVISIFLHILSALSALINSKSSRAMRNAAGIITFIMIIITRSGVGMLKSDTEGIIDSTWTWVILSIIIILDMLIFSPKVGIKRIDYSKSGVDINKPNLPNESLLQRGGWKCSFCSKINASYVNTCPCGNKKSSGR